MSGWKINYLDSPEKIEVTLEQFLRSIEMNGLPQARFAYWNKDDMSSYAVVVNSACALGQAALNLGVEVSTLEREIGKKFRTKGRRSLTNSIIGRNDGHNWSYKTIARYYRRMFADRLNESVVVDRTFTVKKG